MAAPAAAPSVTPADLRRPWRERASQAKSSLRVVWSRPAAWRAVRATLVMPGLFALTSQVIGNRQMATFAAFGSFATLVLANFGGARRNKLIAHLWLAVVGSVLVVIGTAVNSSTALAAVVTVPIAFCVLFAGVIGPNTASGATAVLLAYVLPAASPGTISMLPSRLAGWWLASVVGTLAVLTLGSRSGESRLRAAASSSAAALADQIDASLEGTAAAARAEDATKANRALTDASTASPYRLTGLAVADQALADLVDALEWCTGLVAEAVGDPIALRAAGSGDRAVLAESAAVLHATALLLDGAEVMPDLEALGAASRAANAAADGAPGPNGGRARLHAAFHSKMVGTATRRVALDALIAAGHDTLPGDEMERARWLDADVPQYDSRPRTFVLASARRVIEGHASLRSAWFLNSIRGAVALAAAVAVADLANVQHGFWVVLGTLSVLRTNAASTGATALRALAGTALGFFVGAGLILAIGTDSTVLWAILPVAVFIAAYSPGTAPFAVGQAAFTLTIAILYNLLVPVGWKVGVIRIEDVAIGAGVSVLVGLLFWPRGAAVVVQNDLADAFHRGGIYLVQATAWTLGLRPLRPEAAAESSRASLRLDDALRSLMAEQGTKRIPKEQLWRLVGGALRLRLTAGSLASLPPDGDGPDDVRSGLLSEATRLAGRYDALAAQIGPTPTSVALELAGLPAGDHLAGADADDHAGCVRQYLAHVERDVTDLAEPAAAVSEARSMPWWR